MKGSIAAFLAFVIAGVALYYHSDNIAKNAGGNSEFMSVYTAAKAAREHRGLYSSEVPAKPPEAAEAPKPASSEDNEPNAPVSLGAKKTAPVHSLPPEETIASTESTVTTSAAPFTYPPYFALMMLPLSFIKSLQTAALAWYWSNAVLFLIVMFFAVFALAGTMGTGEKALFLVPLIIAVPFIGWYLPSQSTSILALVFVLGGLCLFRAEQDVLAGLVSSLALFSPLGVLFFIYYCAKRAGIVLIGIIVGAIVWCAVIPAVYFGPQAAMDESQTYLSTVLTPLPAKALSEDVLASPDNYSVWAMLKRNTAGLDSLGTQVGDYAKSQNITVPPLNWTLIFFLTLGIIMLVATLLGIWRKLNDRDLTIVGLEGGLLIMAFLLLAPFTPLSAMILAIFPLCGVVYVIRSTDVRKLAHHMNYVGLILAAQCFCLAWFWKDALTAGATFAGAFLIWIALLAGISQFRPHLVRGRRSIYAEGPRARDERPIELAKVRARGDEKEEKKEKETKEGRGLKGIIPMPSFTWGKKKIEGAAGVQTEPKRPDQPPVDLAPDDKSKDDKSKSGKIKLD